MTDEERLWRVHLGSLYGALYRVLGERAVGFSADAAVVRCYEASRAFGELAAEARDSLGEEVAENEVLAEVLGASADADPTGVTTLGVVASVVGPRLLVTLRDARAVLGDDVEAAARVTVAESLALRDLAGRFEVDAEAGVLAGALERLEAAGYAESFVPPARLRPPV